MSIRDFFIKYWALITLSLLFFIPTLSLFAPGLPLTHDGRDHVARIANFYQNLSEGEVVPRWAGNLNWGYGHPILMFLYPLPSYVASLFHVLGFSYVDSTKLVFGVSYILSGLAMYLWTKQFLRKDAAFFAALLYGFAPYRFVDLYVRGAIGEHTAFLFVPLVCYFFLMTTKHMHKAYMIGGVLSLAALILSHNAVSIMFLPLLGIYLLYLFLQTEEKKRFILSSIGIIFWGFSLSAFFWLPAMLEGKYTLRGIVLKDQYLERFLPLQNIIYPSWGYGVSGHFSVQIGIIHWLSVLGGIGFLISKKIKRNEKIFLGLLLSAFFFSLFLMIDASIIVWKMIPLIQQFQFPWRFLFVSLFTTSVIGGLFLQKLPKHFSYSIIGISCILWLFVQQSYYLPREYSNNPERYYTQVFEGTTDTGESAPIWSVRFMEEFPKAPLEVIGGEAKVIRSTREITRHTYDVVAKNQVQLRENTVYFPGWNIYVDGKNTPIEFQDPHNRGVMTFVIPPGSHNIDVRFEQTKIRLLATGISIAAILSLLIFVIMKKRLL